MMIQGQLIGGRPRQLMSFVVVDEPDKKIRQAIGYRIFCG
ncbi:hypothetical protein BN1221_04018 [Brenneria goodwinii]|uniref:Uncharacterized protein n=1 Tax=Brenneria goodwinii TaxID=1109412 RepID=A0A0G4K094_9GAMM|nr:hypothetical protein BN1221_04018 [Brenneria goodwinii]